MGLKVWSLHPQHRTDSETFTDDAKLKIPNLRNQSQTTSTNRTMKDQKLNSTPPAFLPEHAQEVYRTTVKDLAASGRPLLVIHRESVIGLAQAADLAKQAGEEIRKTGFVMDGGREGVKRNPAISAQIAALASLKAFAAELGLTPGSFKKMPQIEEEERNEFADL
jgi:P27 family predicted phage terminase small subunit